MNKNRERERERERDRGSSIHISIFQRRPKRKEMILYFTMEKKKYEKRFIEVRPGGKG